ncbi:MAG: hypothetical protein ABIR66_04280 [Saprospiraceae bacterium]
MLSFFKKNSFFNSILLLVYTIMLQMIPLIMGSSKAFLGNFKGSGFLSGLIHIFIIYMQAVFINRLVIENRLHRDIMLFPGVFFILFSSLMPEFWSPSHIHLANFFIVWSLYELFQIYKTNNPAVHVFNCSFLIGIASIICPPMIWYLILVLLGISNLKKLQLIHPLQIAIGGIVPWFLWSTYMYWKKEESTIWPTIKGHIGLNISASYTEQAALLRYGLYILIVMLIFLLYNEFRRKKHIQAQKKIDILYISLVISMIAILFHLPAGTGNLLMSAPMLGIFIGLLFSHFKNINVPEMIHLFLFMAVLILQVFYYFIS